MMIIEEFEVRHLAQKTIFVSLKTNWKEINKKERKK